MSGGLGGNWRPDPYGVHEMRYFMGDTPTAMVRDGQSTAHDPPPEAPSRPTPPVPPAPGGALRGQAPLPPFPGAAPSAQPAAQPPPPVNPPAAPGTPTASWGWAVAPPGGQLPPPATVGGRPKRHSLRNAAAAVIVAVALVAGGLAGARAASGSSGWNDTSLHVVGGPVAASGRILVLDTTPGNHLELSAVDTANGTVAWHLPFSSSGITPGEVIGPVAIGNVTLDLDPASSATSPLVDVNAVNVETGASLWSVPSPVELTDAPSVCGAFFCIPAYTGQTASSTALIILNPQTGATVGIVPGPMRSMSWLPASIGTTGGLWQTDATSPSFVQVTASGQAAWTTPVARLFGGSAYDPNSGWVFLDEDGLEVGSVGVDASGTTLAFGSYKTVAIVPGTGTVRWADPGMYLCMGAYGGLRASVLCDFTGVLTKPAAGAQPDYSSIRMSLQGISPETGAVHWTVPLGKWQAALSGDVTYADPTHLLVHLTSGRSAVLDVVTGKTAPASPGEVFWCQQTPLFHVVGPSDSTNQGQRGGTPVIHPCSASGAAVNQTPAHGLPYLGATADGLYVWPSPHGLRAAHIPS